MAFCWKLSCSFFDTKSSSAPIRGLRKHASSLLASRLLSYTRMSLHPVPSRLPSFPRWPEHVLLRTSCWLKPNQGYRVGGKQGETDEIRNRHKHVDKSSLQSD